MLSTAQYDRLFFRGINRWETYQSNSHHRLAYLFQEKTSFQQ